MEALAIIGTIVAMIQKYGVPAALQIISDWQMDNPTIEDFEKLTGKKVRIKKVVEKNTHKKIVKDETIKKRAK